jgi:hypothetical protein
MKGKAFHRPLICLTATFILGSVVTIFVLATVIDCDGTRDCADDGFEGGNVQTTDDKELFVKFKYHPEKLSLSDAETRCKEQRAKLWQVREKPV